ncbi:MAG: hypothetical protein ACI4VT_02120 [Bacilli bacterium]
MKTFYALGYETETGVKYYKLRLAKDKEVGIYCQRCDDLTLELMTKRDINEIARGISGDSPLGLVPITSISQKKMMKEDLETILENSEQYAGTIIDRIALGKKRGFSV